MQRKNKKKGEFWCIRYSRWFDISNYTRGNSRMFCWTVHENKMFVMSWMLYLNQYYMANFLICYSRDMAAYSKQQISCQNQTLRENGTMVCLYLCWKQKHSLGLVNCTISDSSLKHPFDYSTLQNKQACMRMGKEYWV